jgi:lipoyl(octanoyl) transferase
MELKNQIIIRKLGFCGYETSFQAMQAFTLQRTAESQDEFWILQHPPVFTQGQAGKAEHIINPGEIPIVQSDRGGQVTYHGPGQLIIYFLIDIKRKNFGIRKLVNSLENAVIDLLADYQVKAATRPDAPGVYVEGAKICSLGLRIRKGASYHGLSFNLDMDLEPFSRINPCGLKDIKITQLRELIKLPTFEVLTDQLVLHLCRYLEYNTIINGPTAI